VADLSGIVQKLEDKVAAALRDHNLTAAAVGTPAAQSAMAEYDQLVKDANSSIGIKYLALHSVAIKNGFYVDKRDQQEMLGTVAQEMGNMSPNEVLADIKHLKSNYPAIYQCDAVALDRMESNAVEFMSRLPMDQQDRAVAEAKNIQLNARLIQPETRENFVPEPFIQSSKFQPIASPISKKQAYLQQQAKLPRAHSSEVAKNNLDFEPTYTKQQTKISEESISIPVKNLWIGTLLFFCLISGVTLSMLSNFSSRRTQSHVDQININQEADKKTNNSTNSQDGFIASQPIPPTGAPIVLQSKPVVTSGILIPENYGGNINNGVNLSNPVILRPTTPVHSTTPKSNITKSLPVRQRQEVEEALEIPSGKPSSELRSKKKEITSPSEENSEEIVSDSVPISSPSADKKSLQPSQLSSNQNSPEKIVSTYYQDINDRQYQSAWNKLPSDLQQNRSIHPQGYQSFIGFFDRMKSIQVNELIVVEETASQAVVAADLNCEFRKDVKSPLFLRFVLNRNDYNQQWEISRIKLDPNRKSFCG
jgi:ribulose bisphosphate carboxylase small subunit